MNSLVFDLALGILTDDDLAAGALADVIEEQYNANPQAVKIAQRLRKDPRLVTIVQVVAQFGNKEERSLIQKAQRKFMGRHPISNSTNTIAGQTPRFKRRVLKHYNSHHSFEEFKTVLLALIKQAKVRALSACEHARVRGKTENI